MFKKSLIAFALVIPAVALSSAAYAEQAYQGGPKSGVTIRAKSFEANKPYAQAVNVRVDKHVYQGGPMMAMPHAQR